MTPKKYYPGLVKVTTLVVPEKNYDYVICFGISIQYFPINVKDNNKVF